MTPFKAQSSPQPSWHFVIDLLEIVVTTGMPRIYVVLVSPEEMCDMQQSAIPFLSVQGMDIECQAFYEIAEFHKIGNF